MSNILRFGSAVLSKKEKLAAINRILPATIGAEGQGIYVEPLNPDSKIWVTVDDDKLIQVVNEEVPNLAGTPVFLGYLPRDPKTLRIISINSAYNEHMFSGMPDHGVRHQFDGDDPVFVWMQQFMPWIVLPNTDDYDPKLTIRVHKGNLFTGTSYLIGEDELFELDVYRPGSPGVRFVLVQVDNAGTITLKAGTIVAHFSGLTAAMVPLPDSGCIPLASIRIYFGQGKIKAGKEDKTDIADWRPLGAVASVPVGGYSIHTDSTLEGDGRSGTPLSVVRSLFTISSPLDVWSVTHGLVGHPAVHCEDVDGNVIMGEVKYLSDTSFTVTFNNPIEGKVYVG